MSLSRQWCGMDCADCEEMFIDFIHNGGNGGPRFKAKAFPVGKAQGSNRDTSFLHSNVMKRLCAGRRGPRCRLIGGNQNMNSKHCFTAGVEDIQRINYIGKC